MTTTRHPNRTGLRAVTGHPDSDGSAPAGTSALACRCPARVVAGTVWAYDVRLGWHDPAEHDTWTPPRRPTYAPLPAALRPRAATTRPGSTPGRPSPAERRHTVAPAGPGLVVCTSCGLCFDAGACTRAGGPLPACQPPNRDEMSVPGPTVLFDTQEDA